VRIAILTACLCLFGCAAEAPDSEVGAEGLTVYPSPGATIHWTVKPSNTLLPGSGPIGDSALWGALWAPDFDHHIYRGPVSQFCVQPCVPTERLVVFLSGCGGQPAGYTAFMETAFNQGYHVIGLDYPDPCLSCTDDACYANFRQEIAFGDPTSTDVQLDGHAQDAISKRLKAVLLYMEDHDPFGQWGAFLDVDSTAPDGYRPHYSRIVFAGHSLGAGFAAYFAKKFQVQRVVMMSAPADAVDDCELGDVCCRDTTVTPASWLAQHDTPASSYYALAHAQDFGPVNRINRTKANWNAIGVPHTTPHWNVSTAPCVDSCADPTDTDSCSPHLTVALNPGYQPVWEAMLGTP
jgi:pimeloyl-ACP methyl ester carboxylesterase